jgi:hypothetical protein
MLAYFGLFFFELIRDAGPILGGFFRAGGGKQPHWNAIFRARMGELFGRSNFRIALQICLHRYKGKRPMQAGRTMQKVSSRSRKTQNLPKKNWVTRSQRAVTDLHLLQHARHVTVLARRGRAPQPNRLGPPRPQGGLRVKEDLMALRGAQTLLIRYAETVETAQAPGSNLIRLRRAMLANQKNKRGASRVCCPFNARDQQWEHGLRANDHSCQSGR